jgi:thiol-disulfide isomerase/thioredoxin
MALTHTPPGDLGSVAPSFELIGIDGKVYSLKSFEKSRALVVMFICNHCPYVKAINPRISMLARTYTHQSVSFVAINSNDFSRYPDDSVEAMRAQARYHAFPFPYLVDETQEIARAYGAVCTPDFYVYENADGQFVLRYRGRLDDSWKDPQLVRRRELASALDAIFTGKPVNAEQPSSMGCSIKWKT